MQLIQTSISRHGKYFIVDLEKVFDDFRIIPKEYELLVSNEEFVDHRVVNGEGLTSYNANVKQAYSMLKQEMFILK